MTVVSVHEADSVSVFLLCCCVLTVFLLWFVVSLCRALGLCVCVTDVHVRPFVKCASSLLWGFTASVSRVYHKCLLQPVCCFWSAMPARLLCSCMHAKSNCCNVCAITWLLSSCWELNGDFLLQLAKDSKINLLQGLESLGVPLQQSDILVHISV